MEYKGKNSKYNPLTGENGCALSKSSFRNLIRYEARKFEHYENLWLKVPFSATGVSHKS